MSSNTSELNFQELGVMNDILVKAGAGAGKTTELVARVLSMAKLYKQQEGKYPKLIVTTFTRKSTQEMRGRLISKAYALGDEDLVEYVQKTSLLHISTIHGVLSLFLQKYGIHIGLIPQYSLSQAHEELKLKKKNIRNLLKTNEEFTSNFYSLLEVLDFNQTLEAFYEYYEMTLQFNTIYRADLQDLWKASQITLKKWQANLNEFSQKILEFETSKNWLILSEQSNNLVTKLNGLVGVDPLQTIHEIFLLLEDFKNNKKSVRANKNTPDFLTDLRKEVFNELDHFLDSHTYRAEFWSKYEDLSKKFEFCAKLFSDSLLQAKLDSSKITMNDLELLSIYLLNNHPQIADHFSEEWNYWFIDEYQDTSPRQVELIEKLMGKKKGFFVGDPQQSIYLFRGARSEVFQQKIEEIQTKKEGGLFFEKRNNYRSRKDLLLFFNYFFSTLSPQFSEMNAFEKNSNKPRKEEACAHYLICENETENIGSASDSASNLNHSPDRIHDPETDSETKLPGEQKKNQAPEGDLIEDENLNIEIEACLFRCQELLKQNVLAESICVLGRRNEDLRKIAMRAFELGIPVQVHSSGAFFLRREIRDAISLLKFLLNPHDNVNLIELLRSPIFPLSDDKIQSFCSFENKSYWEKLKALNLKPDLELLLKETNESGLVDTWKNAILNSKLMETCHLLDPSGRREANLWKLISLLKEEENRAGFNLMDFIYNRDQGLISLEDQNEGDATPVIEPNRINLMTVHAAKGLEFDYIVLPFCGSWQQRKKAKFFMKDEENKKWVLSLPDSEEQKFQMTPLGELLETENLKRLLEEYDRLLYVALTRARSGVSLIWSKVKKNSWADRLPFRDHTEKLLEMDDFKILIRRGIFSPEIQEKQISFQEEEKPILNISSKNIIRKTKTITSLAKDFKKMEENTSESIYKSENVNENDDKEKLSQTLSSLTNELFLQQKKIIFGIESHFDYEKLKYNENLIASDLKKQKSIDFIKNCENGQLIELIKFGYVEWGFSLLQNNHLIKGQIDLWGQVSKEEVWLIDYKSGSSGFKEEAFLQLEFYNWALLKMKKISESTKVQLLAVYPYEEKIYKRQSLYLNKIKSYLA